MTKELYKSALIGLGGIGWKYDGGLKDNSRTPQTHAGAYQLHEKTNLVAGCSPEKNDRESFAKNYKVDVFDNIEELLKKTKPDIVSICSPSNLHFQHVQKCIEAGVPMIWLEKPPVLGTEELKQLIRKKQNQKPLLKQK